MCHIWNWHGGACQDHPYPLIKYRMDYAIFLQPVLCWHKLFFDMKLKLLCSVWYIISVSPHFWIFVSSLFFIPTFNSQNLCSTGNWCPLGISEEVACPGAVCHLPPHLLPHGAFSFLSAAVPSLFSMLLLSALLQPKSGHSPLFYSLTHI